MSALGYHIRLRLKDDRVIAGSTEHRRLAARVMLQHGRQHNLLAASLADSHLHSECLCDRRHAGRFAHSVEASLKQRLQLPVGFVQYEPKPIRDSRHLRTTFKYILTQHRHHGFPLSARFEASNIPDLLGMRTLGRYTLDNVKRWLPSINRADILRWLDLQDLHPSDGPIDRIRAATLAATGLHSLDGQGAAVRSAHRAMLEILGDRLPPGRAADLVGISPRTLRRIRKRPAEPLLVNAIRLQLGYFALRSEQSPEQSPE